jgi:methyl-accepting chemotaxis protein
MNWLLNLSTRSKLLLSVGVLLLLLVGAIAASMWSLRRISGTQAVLIEHDLATVIALGEMRELQDRQRIRMLEAMLDPNARHIEEITGAINDAAREIDQCMDQLQRLADGATAAPLGELRAVVDAYRTARSEQVALIRQGKLAEAREIGTRVQEQRFDRIVALEKQLYDAARAQSSTNYAAVRSLVRNVTLGLGATGLVAFVFGLVIALNLSRSIASPLTRISRAAGQLAGGDLSPVDLPVDRRDEVGDLARSFTRLTESLRDQIGNITEGVGVVSAAAAQISSSTTQLAATSAETAAAVSETTTTVEELRQTALVASQKAKTVSESSQRAAQVAVSGRRSVDDTVAEMNRIREQMESIAERMVRLNEQSQSIGQIVSTVEDLATQSNMLAVNAGIEAAKAGEHGRGFAVVAQEVRNLAEQSRQATVQVMAILQEIQKATNAAMLATEQGGKRVEAGASQANQAGQSIQALSSSVSDSAAAASQIAASSQQQLVGVDQVVSSMEGVKQASLQNADGAKQLEAAARNLKDLGERLSKLIQHYRL